MPSSASSAGGSVGEEVDAMRGSQPDQPSFATAPIIDSIAHTGAYLIQLPAGPIIPAVDVLQVSGLPMGARPIGQFAARTRVFFYYHPGLEYALILGAVPRGVSSAQLVLPDSLTLRDGGIGIQESHHYSALAEPETIIPNHSVGRPVDTLPGDWGSINDMGVAVYIGRMVAALKASDAAKVEAFWGDDLLRLTGYNTEWFTAARQATALNDEGEYNEVARMSPYPWEGMGVDSPTAGSATASIGALAPGAEAAPLEPHELDQLIIPRLVRMRGYLGDLEKEWVVKPPDGLGVETYSKPSIYTGLLEITKSLNGAYHVRSAKEITLEKYTLIPVPKEMIAPDDPTGDNRDNYKAADVLGTGDAYELPEYAWGDETPSIRAAALWEYHSYLFGAYNVAAIASHTLDWLLPPEDANELAAPAIYEGDLQIEHAFEAPLPGFGTLQIDHRPGNSVRYYRSRSIFKQFDDGSVLMEDGYGSSIRMAGGNIYLDCVGDIFAKPGRSFVAWAPHDAIIRAGNAVDITASKSDVRLKAERNLHMLSGNSGSGGTLIENRATSFARPDDFSEVGAGVNGHGIVIKATQSSFYAFANDIHVGRGQSTNGRLTLDAGTQGTLYLRGRNIHNRNLGIFTVVRDTLEGGSRQLFSLDLNTAIVSTPMQIGGSVIMAPANGQGAVTLVVGGAVVAHGQGIFDGAVLTNNNFGARGSNGFVGSFEDEIDLGDDPAELAGTINEQRDAIGNAVGLINTATVDSSDQSPGNDRFQARIGFSLRTTDDMFLNSTFLIYESRWQQMLRFKGVETIWDEPEVKAPNGVITLPHPGQEGWEEFEAFGQINNDNFNAEGGFNNPRNGLQQQGQAPVKGSLKSGYLINVQGAPS